MKIIYIILLCFIICHITYTDENDRNIKNIKGNVKEKKTIIYNVKEIFNKIYKTKTGYWIERFDYRGNLIEHSYYDASNKLIYNEVTEYKYNENEKIYEILFYNKNILESKKIFKYDNNGNLIENIYFDGDGNQINNEVYKYDKNKRLLESIKFRKNNTISENMKYKYDENGNEIEIYVYYEVGAKSNFIYKYDEKNNVKEYTCYDLDGSKYQKNIYNYDNDGNLIESILFDKYDNIWKKETRKYFKNKKVNEIVSYEYDSSGNVIEQNIGINDENGYNIEFIHSELNYDESFKEVSKYNDIGNVISISTFTLDTKLNALGKNLKKYKIKFILFKEFYYEYFDN